MKPQRNKGKQPTPRKAVRRSTLKKTEPVEVCLRVRDLTSEARGSCIEMIDDRTVRLTGPAPDYRTHECKFSQVFNDAVNQKILFDHVGAAMVEDLILGKDGLLFTYGVTSSGKTYTMNGTGEQPGFLPRTLDMLFNTIDESLQADKHVFLPGYMNNFTIQSDVDVMLQRQDDIMLDLTKKTHQTSKPLRFDIEHLKSAHAKRDHRYALFISYCEIYNDQVTDLLAETKVDNFKFPKPAVNLRLREDERKQMFVCGAQMVEVKNVEEAFAVLQRGQERKKMANTQLNATSSRSHSIFNIKLVQAPLDPMGEDLLEEPSLIKVSQLSMVDLAGSERMSRTGVRKGERVREAGNINSSLMTLRLCLDQLRKNQKSSVSVRERVSYRNSKLTHLFKSYFEGSGKVKMIICINPNMDEYDENIQVVQFAEAASQVKVALASDYELTQENLKLKLEKLGRDKARKEQAKMERLQEQRRKKLAQSNHANNINNKSLMNITVRSKKSRVTRIPSDRSVASTVSVGSSTGSVSVEGDNSEGVEWDPVHYPIVELLPSFQMIDYADEATLPNLIAALKRRKAQCESTEQNLDAFSNAFRGNLKATTASDGETKAKISRLRKAVAVKAAESEKLKKNNGILESKNKVLQQTSEWLEDHKQKLQVDLESKESELKNCKLEVKRANKQMKGAVANTKADAQRKYDSAVKNVQMEMEGKMAHTEQRWRQIKEAVAETTQRPVGGAGAAAAIRLQAVKSTANVYGTPRAAARHQRPGGATATPRQTPSYQAAHMQPKIRGRTPAVPKPPRTLISVRPKSTADPELTTPRPKPARRSRSAENLLSVVRQSEPRVTAINQARDEPSSSDSGTYSSPAKNLKKINVAVNEQKVPYVNQNRQRSNSAQSWIAHRPDSTVSTSTIFQPKIRPSRVVNVPSPKDISKSSNYLLTHQTETLDGAVTTQLVKGEVYATSTGGQQVQFVDIETLAKHNPLVQQQQQQQRPKPAARKRRSDEEWTDVETRCAYGIGSSGNVTPNPKKRTKK